MLPIKKHSQGRRVRTFQKLKIDTFAGSQIKNYSVQNFSGSSFTLPGLTKLLSQLVLYHDIVQRYKILLYNITINQT